MIKKNKPRRCAKYLRWMRQELRCCVCGAPNPDPHHIKGHKRGGMGMKGDDFDTIPLCSYHHVGDCGIHQMGVDRWEIVFGSQLEYLRDVVEMARDAGWLK